jgi:hypothetical protein
MWQGQLISEHRGSGYPASGIGPHPATQVLFAGTGTGKRMILTSQEQGRLGAEVETWNLSAMADCPATLPQLNLMPTMIRQPSYDRLRLLINSFRERSGKQPCPAVTKFGVPAPSLQLESLQGFHGV